MEIIVVLSDFESAENGDAPWNRVASSSVGLPDVGMGTQKALLSSSSVTPYLSFSPRLILLILPAWLLFRLPLRRKLPLLLNDAFFFSVLARDGNVEWGIDICDSARGTSNEDPRRLMSSSS